MSDRYQVKTPNHKLSKEKQLWLLNNHPAFTGVCSNCGYQYDKHTNNWTCPQCHTSYQ